ncbi:phage tail protein [Paenibacillus sp. Dod16]|uniref:phage tail protein n=1 Tax=Paenibacillus sp. Dod16 TaxID=3416392 RepID=UPI003CED5CA5
MQKAQQDLASFKSGLTKSIKGIVGVLATIGIGSAIKDATKDAMQYEASIVQLNRTMGESAAGFRSWAKENAAAFGMSQLEIAKYGAVYSNLLSSFTSGTAETTQKTQELLQASAVVASATGRTMEDTMERIRSGLLGNTEAIEDLGINVNVAMIESTKAFQQFANGKSWQQLNFQTQQQIRLMAILEQAQSKYGNEIADTTIARQNQLVAQLKNVRLGLGQAFMPIYNFILPALIRFATALATVMNYIAQFTTALFGGSVKSQNAQAQATNAQTSAVSGLGDAYKKAGDKAKKAGKKAKDSAGSFDQLNLVGGKNSDSSGSSDDASGEDPLAGMDPGGAGFLGDLSEGFIDVSDQAQSMADKVRTSFQNAFTAIKDAWKMLVVTFAPSFQQAWGQIQPVLLQWKEQFKTMFSDIMSLGQPLADWIQTGLIPLWQDGITTVGHILSGLLDSILNIVRSIWEAAFPILDKFVREGLPRITEFLTGAMDIFKKLFDLVKKIFDDIWKNVVDPVMKLISKIITETLDLIFQWWDKWGKKIFNSLKEAVDKLKELWNNLWENFLKPITERALKFLTDIWDKHLKDLIREVLDFIGKLAQAALDIFNEFIMPIVNWLVKKLGPIFAEIFDGIMDVLTTAIGAVIDAAKGIIKALGGIVEFIAGVFTGDWKRAWEGIKTFMSGIGDAIVAIFKGAVNAVIDALNWMIRQVSKVKIDIPDWVPGLGGKSMGFSIPEIPKLAKGGLAYGPTLAMVGDNRGASADPEVIAPLSKLQDIMGGGGDSQQTVSVLNAILSAIKSGQNVNVQISQKAIGQAAIQEIKNETRRTGAVPFPV